MHEKMGVFEADEKKNKSIIKGPGIDLELTH